MTETRWSETKKILSNHLWNETRTNQLNTSINQTHQSISQSYYLLLRTLNFESNCIPSPSTPAIIRRPERSCVWGRQCKDCDDCDDLQREREGDRESNVCLLER